MSLRIPLSIELESEDCGCMAETTILLGGRVVGYIGASRYTSRTEEEAIDAVFETLAPLIQAHPEVETRSRFDLNHEEDEDDDQ